MAVCLAVCRPFIMAPGGAELPVTNENLKEYVELYVDWLLTKSVAPHFDAFRKGFLKVGR